MCPNHDNSVLLSFWNEYLPLLSPSFLLTEFIFICVSLHDWNYSLIISTFSQLVVLSGVCRCEGAKTVTIRVLFLIRTH